MRGPSVFTGYYKDAGKTAETLTKDGWLRTGDIAKLTRKGAIAIIDRKKNIFKLAQGEYVAPEKIEPILARCRWISQLYLHGDGLQPHLVLIAVVNEDNVKAWAKPQLRGAALNWDTLCGSPALRKLVISDVRHICKTSGLKGFETPQNVHLEFAPWTPEGGLVTPTLKVKRKELEKHYRPVIDRLYAEGIAFAGPQAKESKL